MNKVKIILVVVICLGFAVYLIFPRYDADANYMVPGWWEKSLFNFCKYTVPSGYEIGSLTTERGTYPAYREGRNQDKYVIVFKNSQTSQIIVLSRLRGFHYVPFDKIRTVEHGFWDAFSRIDTRITESFKIDVFYPLPYFLKQKDMAKMPDGLILKGIVIEKKEEYSTDKANVYYLNGSFRRIGFFKDMPFPWGFATPVFDFLNSSKGAVAILNNKEAKETIITVSFVPSYKDFDEGAFKKFISSITFDKEVFKPYWPEGVAEPKPKVKYGF